jgi:chromosome segregation ATPase
MRVATGPAASRSPEKTEQPVQTAISADADLPGPVEDNVALGYVTSLKNLITFHEKEFETLTATMAKWDNEINALTNASNRILDQIDQAGNELREKKNLDSKSFSGEIIEMKKQLNGYRENYRKSKEDLLEKGDKIVKEVEKISSTKIKAAGDIYNDVSQDIRSTRADPSADPVSVTVNQKDLTVNGNISEYISPSLEMLVWHTNEIKGTCELIKRWNIKVREVMASGRELNSQLVPLKSKLDEYQSDTKKYKEEISSLKKQISGLEKEMKNLAGQMEDDSKELAGYVKQARAEVQKSLEQRFTDIIENINYSFREN